MPQNPFSLSQRHVWVFGGAGYLGAAVFAQMDAGYGKEPALLRALDAAGECFVVEVHRFAARLDGRSRACREDRLEVEQRTSRYAARTDRGHGFAMACARYFIERSFQDAKTSLGLADYQTSGWLAWHHERPEDLPK